MVGCRIRSAAWVRGLLEKKFFDPCGDHGELRKNEKNFYCIDCECCVCKHCVAALSHGGGVHRLLQICKYVYHDVVRLQDVQKHLDCSFIQAYKINGERAVHLNPRPQPARDNAKSSSKPKLAFGATACESCGRHIQEFPNRFCSIACKVQVDSVEHEAVVMPNIDGHVEREISSENGISLSESSTSEVIQACNVGSSLKPRKRLNKRKGFPRRAPLW